MRIWLSIIFLIPLSLKAFVPLPCEPGLCVGAEWIYFSPTSETSYYAIDAIATSPMTLQTRIGNFFDHYESGYRIFASYQGCRGFLAGRWTSLHVNHSTTFSTTFPPDVILPVIGLPSLFSTMGETALANFASDSKRFEYHAFDVIGGGTLLSTSPIALQAFAGLHGTHLRTKENYAFNLFDPMVTTLSGTLRDSFCGLGPELGLSTTSAFGCILFQATATGAFLIGKHKSSSFAGNVIDNTPASSDVHNQPAWIVVPHADFRVGLKYLLSRCAWSALFEIGYEVPVYFNALSDLLFPDSTQIGVSFDHTRNVTMHGPYASLTLTF